MPAPPQARRYTVEEVLSWPPDGNRYEVVHGELLVTPSPAPLHQVVLGRLTVALVRYLDSLGKADAFLPGPVDYFHGSDVYVQPDFVVIWPQEITASYRTMRRLRLVIEVISPSSARGDRLVKRAAYQEAGAETYWVVDPSRAVVEVWRPSDEVAEIAARELVWRLSPEAAELRINLSELFAKLPA